MSEYDLVLYAGQSSDFIEKLRGLGLVDITTTGWEPSDEDRQLLLTIDNHHKAVETLKRFLEDERFVKDEQPIADGGEAFDRYMAATQQAAALRSEIARLQKTADELRPWGDFSVQIASQVSGQGRGVALFLHQPCGLREGYRGVVGALYDRSGARG